MSAKRRRRSGPPPPRKRPDKVRVVKPPRREPSEAEIDQAIRAVLGRRGWSVLDSSRDGVQRRGSDRSSIYSVRMKQDDVVRRSTIVAHLSNRTPPGGIKPVIVNGHRVWVWRYPSDPFLPGLPRATSNRKIRVLLDEFGVVAGQPKLQRRVYRATRRAVVQADILDGDENVLDTIYVKVLGDRDPDVIREKTRRLAEHHQQLAPHVPVPRLVGVVAEDGILATANVPGETLRKAILDEERIPTPAAVAALSIDIAPLRVDSDATPMRYADPTRHAKTIGEILPKERARARGLVEACEITGPLVTVHGDFHDGQVLVKDGAITGLIDIDGLGEGLLAHDAGRMIAYVESIGDIERSDNVRVDGFVAGLRAAYADHVDDETLARAIGAAWVALATGPHRRQQKDWAASTIRRLDHAERWLRQAGAI